MIKKLELNQLRNLIHRQKTINVNKIIINLRK